MTFVLVMLIAIKLGVQPPLLCLIFGAQVAMWGWSFNSMMKKETAEEKVDQLPAMERKLDVIFAMLKARLR